MTCEEQYANALTHAKKSIELVPELHNLISVAQPGAGTAPSAAMLGAVLSKAEASKAEIDAAFTAISGALLCFAMAVNIPGVQKAQAALVLIAQAKQKLDDVYSSLHEAIAASVFVLIPVAQAAIVAAQAALDAMVVAVGQLP